ncbi:hypothetical protein EJB05_48293, partial [Eragrostis curvula]
MTRRCARRAELYHRVDAYCEEARLREARSRPHFANSPPPPPAEAPREDDEDIWSDIGGYFKRRYCHYYRMPFVPSIVLIFTVTYIRSLTGREPNLGISPLTEGFIRPPPEKRQRNLCDKDGEQSDGGRHSSECEPTTVLCKLDEGDGGEDEQGDNHVSDVPSKRRRQKSLSIKAYAAQCSLCGKWRLVQSKRKYEEIRAHITKTPFKCEKAREWKPDVICNDPSDVHPDVSRLWAVDQHDIAETPPGWERFIKIRSEGGIKFADVYYLSPAGKTLRSTIEVKKYLEENPQYVDQGVRSSQFSFKIPAPSRPDYVRKRTQTNRNDGALEGSIQPLPEQVQPIAWAAPPMDEGPSGDNNQLVPYNEDPSDVLLGLPAATVPPESQETMPGNLLPPAGRLVP